MTDHPITITPNPHRIRVMLGGTIVAETTRALTLREGGMAPVQYIPREQGDVQVNEVLTAAEVRERRRREEAEKEMAAAEKDAARREREARAEEAARRRYERENPGLIQQVTKSAVFRDFVRTAGREIVRGIFGTGRRR